MRSSILLVAMALSTPAFADPTPAAEPVLSPPSMVQPMPDLDQHLVLGTPPISAGRVTGEVVAGAALGAAGLFLGGLVGALIGTSMENCSQSSGDWCGIGGLIVGGAIGGGLGGALGVGGGVYLVGASGDQTGSFWAASGGALAGGVLGLAVAAGISANHDIDTGTRNALAVGTAIAGPLVGGVLGFNLTRKYDRLKVAPMVRPGRDGYYGISLVSSSF